MIKKKAGYKIIIGIFIVIICFSRLWWILFEKFADSANYENRKPAARPQLTVDNYGTFSSAYESYFNDNLPFRNNLITMNTAIDYFVFGRSTSKRVIVGNDNWLFYADTNDGDPIGCYQGTNLLSEEELQSIAQNCQHIQAFLNEYGIEFVIFIAPNKERIYSNKMPKQYGDPFNVYRALQVVDYLRANTDVRVIYPYEELMEAKNSLSEDIWYKTDTHWNRIGGYIGALALLFELGIEIPDITSDVITITAKGETAGDLANMLNLANILKSVDQEYIVTGYNDHGMETIEDASIYHAEGADPRKIYVCRDSFFLNMATYIGSQFTDTYVRHKRAYTYNDFVQQNPDIFVYETVERYVGQLESFSIQQ